MSVVEKSSQEGRRPLLVVLFVVYLVLLAWIVLWKLELPHVGSGALRQLKLVPFAPSGEDEASAPLEVVANILFFVPFGIYLGLLAPSWQWWKTLLAVALGSVALELAQYVLAVGRSDMTDLVANTAGGLAGIGLLAFARRRFQGSTMTVMRRVCLIGTVLAVIVAAIFIVSPLQYAQREAPFGSQTE